MSDLSKRKAPEILLTHLQEGIGIALDLKGERMFLTDLTGSVYSAKLNGSDKKILLYAQGNLTGIAYAELPSKACRLYKLISIDKAISRFETMY